MKALITGVGGELGTRVASLLEADGRIEEILGLDAYPPRRLLRRTRFERIDPRDRRRAAATVREFRPGAVVHLGIYEPGARSRPGTADEQTSEGTVAALGAAVEFQMPGTFKPLAERQTSTGPMHPLAQLS